MLSVAADHIVPPVRNLHRVRVINAIMSGDKDATDSFFLKHHDVLRVIVNACDDIEFFLQRTDDLTLDFSVRASVIVFAHVEVFRHKVPYAEPVRSDSSPHFATDRDEQWRQSGSLSVLKQSKDFLILIGCVGRFVKISQVWVTVIEEVENGLNVAERSIEIKEDGFRLVILTHEAKLAEYLAAFC